MSKETYIQFRTITTPEEVKAALVRDPALADLGLIERSNGWIGGGGVNVIVDPWNADPDPEEDDRHTISGGFEMADLLVGVIFGDYEARCRVIAALLRLVPGDVCLADYDSAGPNVLRLDGTVYVNPRGYRPENLTDFGYAPERMVIGIPAQAAEAAAE